MEIFENFGIDWTLTLAQIINFLIIFYILKRYLYRPIFNMLEKRKDAIKEGIKNAEEGKIELERALEKEAKIIKEAQNKAQAIIQDAKNNAQEQAKEIEERAKNQADRMIADAKIQIEIEVKKAEQLLNKHVSDLSIKLLRKSLPKIISNKEQSEIISKAIKEFEKQPN